MRALAFINRLTLAQGGLFLYVWGKLNGMVWLDNNSFFTFGKYKGKKVSEVKDAEYIKWLHENKEFNLFFTEDVFRRLKTNHKGEVSEVKKYASSGTQNMRQGHNKAMWQADKEDAKWMSELVKKRRKSKKQSKRK